MRGVRVPATILAGAAACAALASCGQSITPAAVGTVPWLDAPASAQATPFTLPGVTACAASDLDVSVHVADPSYVNAGPLNTSFWVITVSDRSARPCFVGAAPAVSFEASGTQVAVDRAPPMRNSGADIVYLAPPATALAPFFPRATGEIDVTPCVLHGIDHVSVDFGETRGATRVSVGPPGGFGTPCPSGHETYSVSLRGVAGDTVTGTTIPHTQTSIEAPSVVRPGTVVPFSVTILNRELPHFGMPPPSPTPQPILTFAPCPTYHVEIEGIPGAFQTHRLNCAAARPIPDGGSETFQMEVTVPATAALGPATLLWSMDGPPGVYQPARIDLQIVSG